jgi:hypothetical protein
MWQAYLQRSLRGTTMKVTDFSSVLQIAFGLNLVFILIELKPLVDQDWRRLNRRFSSALQDLWELVLDGKESSRAYAAITSYEVAYICVEFISIIFSGTASAISLGLLIAAGYNPSLVLDAETMRGVLLVSFLTSPIYVLLSTYLIRMARKKFEKLEAKLRTQKA